MVMLESRDVLRLAAYELDERGIPNSAAATIAGETSRRQIPRQRDRSDQGSRRRRRRGGDMNSEPLWTAMQSALSGSKSPADALKAAQATAAAATK